MRLRADPWEPEYGASIELDVDLEPPPGLDFAVETDGDWHPIPAPQERPLPCCAFIDGVRRIDLRLSAEEDDLWAPGLAGSWAAGCAWSRQPPEIGEVRVGRVLVTGGGLQPPHLDVRVGGHSLNFVPCNVEGLAPLDPLAELQRAMRDAEADLALRTLHSDNADLVVIDGPLNYGMSGRAVGMIKRQARTYLDAEHAPAIGELGAGERTPIFKFGERRTERYSWYLRLAEPRSIEAGSAGIVRLEVGAGSGADNARVVAEMTSAILPRFAPRPGWDARAPQNLYPIAALESVLRRRLGDGALVRRALEASIYKEVLDGR